MMFAKRLGNVLTLLGAHGARTHERGHPNRDARRRLPWPADVGRWLVTGAAVATVAGPLAVTPALASPSSPDPTIVIMGDSFIAGQGDTWDGNPAPWTDPVYASRGSGQAIYGSTLDDPTQLPGNGDGCHRADPSEADNSSITMSTRINIACSGATTADVYSAKGPASFKGESPQIQQLQAIAAGHKVKLIVLSIGGNDLGFTSIISACAQAYLWGQGTCNAKQQSNVTAALPTAMNSVRAVLQQIQTVMAQAGYGSTDYRLILQSYPSVLPTSDRLMAATYDRDMGIPQGAGYNCSFYNEDADWTNTWLVPQIANGLHAQADSMGVQFVDIQNLFRGHELCATTPVTTPLPARTGPTSSLNGSMDWLEWVHMLTPAAFHWPNYAEPESMHPNAYGHQAMATCIGQVYNQHPYGDQSCAGAAGTSNIVVSPLAVVGKYLPLVFNPGSLDLGNIPLSSNSAAETVTLTNSSPTPLALGGMSLTGDFSIASNTCPGNLAVRASCTVSITFTPTTTGLRTGGLTISDNGWPNTETVALTGTGLNGSLSFSGTYFGVVQLPGDQAQNNVVVHNDSSVPVTVSGVSLSGNSTGAFSILTDACSGHVLGANQSCPVTVDFAPRAPGTSTAQLVITDNGVPTQQSAALSGSATGLLGG